MQANNPQTPLTPPYAPEPPPTTDSRTDGSPKLTAADAATGWPEEEKQEKKGERTHTTRAPRHPPITPTREARTPGMPPIEAQSSSHGQAPLPAQARLTRPSEPILIPKLRI